MKACTRVVVYGSSLHMAGIAASLEAEPDLEVISVNPRLRGARQLVRELDPDVLTFDLSSPHAGLELIGLCEGLGLLLIGADPNSDELVVLFPQRLRALSVADLVTIIRRRNRAIVRGEGAC